MLSSCTNRVFTDFFGLSEKVLFIAGGIGITPIRPLMEETLQKGKNVTLLYGNKFRNEIVFEKELEKLRSKYPAQVIYVLSAEADFQGEKGRIDMEKLDRLIPNISEREIYICGLVPMMNSIINILKNSFKMPASRIHCEKSSF